MITTLFVKENATRIEKEWNNGLYPNMPLGKTICVFLLVPADIENSIIYEKDNTKVKKFLMSYFA